MAMAMAPWPLALAKIRSQDPKGVARPCQVGVRDPRTGYFGPWVRVVDWAWTPEETSSRPRRRRRRRRHRGGGNPKIQILRFSMHVDDLGTIFTAF